MKNQGFDKKTDYSLDLGKKEIKNVVVHKLSNDLNNPAEGQVWYNSTDDTMKVFNGIANREFVFSTETDTINSIIGDKTQISNTPNVITKTGTVLQMINQLDVYKSIQTIKKTVGGVGIAADFNFVTAEDQVEQVINLGALIPAKAKVINALVYTDDVFTDAVSLSCTLGNSSSGDELVAATDMIAADTIGEGAAGVLTLLPTLSTAQTIYLSATPGANWSLVTAGKLSVYVTYINLSNI